jgi:hypothetical protein
VKAGLVGLLVVFVVVALSSGLWFVFPCFVNRPKPKVAFKEPWLKSLHGLMKMPGGAVQLAQLAGMAHAIASGAASSSRKIEESPDEIPLARRGNELEESTP